MIEDIVREVEVGQVYTGRVTRLMKFGAFVEVLPGKEGLCHISQLAKHRVEKVEDVVRSAISCRSRLSRSTTRAASI